MKKNLTELVFIIDKSGSMSGLEGDTIGGFNSMLKKQRAEEGEAYLSTVLFDTEERVLYPVAAPHCSTRWAEQSSISTQSTNTPARTTGRKRPCSSSSRTAVRTPAADTTLKRSAI